MRRLSSTRPDSCLAVAVGSILEIDPDRLPATDWERIDPADRPDGRGGSWAHARWNSLLIAATGWRLWGIPLSHAIASSAPYVALTAGQKHAMVAIGWRLVWDGKDLDADVTERAQEAWSLVHYCDRCDSCHNPTPDMAVINQHLTDSRERERVRERMREHHPITR